MTISICICTRDRPAVLMRCLESIKNGAAFPDEVLVSDDSSNPQATRDVCSLYGFVKYLSGPRTGLCANRNHVVESASSDYIALADDDSVISHSFVRVAKKIVPATDPLTIFTGDVYEYDKLLPVSNPTFLGHFGGPIGDCHKTIHLNCNLFPRRAFSDAKFDESIIFGYEDMDLCAQLLSLRYKIVYEPSLHNGHMPPHRDEAEQSALAAQINYSRFYCTLKRYLLLERSAMATVAFFFIAPLNLAAHYVKAGKFGMLLRPFTDIVRAARSVEKYKQEVRRLNDG